MANNIRIEIEITEDNRDAIVFSGQEKLPSENANGRSQTFIGNKIAVSINPDTGILIQTNPLRKGRRK